MVGFIILFFKNVVCICITKEKCNYLKKVSELFMLDSKENL